MTLLIILLVVFAVVALMVTVGERYAKPMDEQQQRKYSKILPLLVFVLLFASLIKMLIG
jgi:heme/copper-type cytochrome/quinol oxidase subunit 2